jgi:uncharacterized protein YbaR (Trm112 family)
VLSLRGVAQPGSALAWGARGRRFKSCRPDQLRRIAVDTELLNILACPVCKGKLVYKKAQKELICQFDKLAYPIRDNIPVMLPDEARCLSEGD